MHLSSILLPVIISFVENEMVARMQKVLCIPVLWRRAAAKSQFEEMFHEHGRTLFCDSLIPGYAESALTPSPGRSTWLSSPATIALDG
jgi:hypothetical protein